MLPRIIFGICYKVAINQNCLALACIQIFQLVLDTIALLQHLQTSLKESIVVTVFSGVIYGKDRYQNTHTVLL